MITFQQTQIYSITVAFKYNLVLVSGLTSVFLRAVVVVDLFADTFAFAEVTGQILLLLLVVMSQQLLPVVWIYALLLLDDLSLNLFLLKSTRSEDKTKRYMLFTFRHTAFIKSAKTTVKQTAFKLV